LYATIGSDIESMRKFLAQHKHDSGKIHLVFEISGQAGRKKIAIVAVARKLLGIMRAMMLTGELFNEQLVAAAIRQAA